MGQVQAWRMGNTVIPMDQAKHSVAYRCPFTGKIFSDKTKYTKHLVSHREEIHRQTVRNKFFAEIEQLWECSSFTAIIDWFTGNPKIVLEAIRQSGCSRDIERPIDEFWFSITEFKLTYSDSVSNTHNAPDGKPTNWHRKDDLPTGYPGWRGRIAYRSNFDVFANDALSLMKLKTGSGGGRKGKDYYSGQHDVILFSEDWPKLQSYAVERKMKDLPWNFCFANGVVAKPRPRRSFL